MTAQVHEKLIYEGKESSMAFCPPFPENDPRIKELKDNEIHERSSEAFSTACWRGYIGTWEIKDGRFYLVDIMGRYKIAGESPIFAEWFSGVIRIPRGDILQYVHMGFGSVYEEELHVKIENGLVVKTELIDNRRKEVDPLVLGWKNLPGFENRFEGDEDL